MKLLSKRALTKFSRSDFSSMKQPQSTQWYVLTGGPSSGKTTTIELLRARGFKVVPEHAREYIDEQLEAGKTLAEIRSHNEEFQRVIIQRQIEHEESLNPHEQVFLDRAIPDSLAYYRFLGLEPDHFLLDAVRSSHYKKVFVLELLPLSPDEVRTEDLLEQQRIHDELIQVYRELDCRVEVVPVMEAQERVDYILSRL